MGKKKGKGGGGENGPPQQRQQPPPTQHGAYNQSFSLAIRSYMLIVFLLALYSLSII